MRLGLIRLFSGHPVPDAAKLVFYRPDFYGARAKEFTHEAMRGPSAWPIGERELMAAYVSKVNESAFCIAAHTATARRAYQDGPMVAAVNNTSLRSSKPSTSDTRRLIYKGLPRRPFRPVCEACG